LRFGVTALQPDDWSGHALAHLRITVIIPTVNEGATLSAAIQSCLDNQADQIIIADGGSSDDTHVISERLGCRWVQASPPQRARQMNAAAREANGDLIVFLHADSILEAGALASLRSLASDHRILGGGFRRRYLSSSLVLALSCRLGNLRARWVGWYFGDQAIWARRDIFLKMGGFPEKPLFEDMDFTRRLARRGRMRLVTPGIQTSSRRFDTKVASTVAHDFLMTLRHLLRGSRP
jgi:rSAM/selenodomain-associated transferase 2